MVLTSFRRCSQPPIRIMVMLFPVPIKGLQPFYQCVDNLSIFVFCSCTFFPLPNSMD